MDFSSKQSTQPKLFLEPRSTVNPSAVKAIHDADVIVIAPGDIYTSLGPLLVVDGVAEALAKTKAKKVYISNLVVKPHQTKGFTVADRAAELERFAGSHLLIMCCITQINQIPRHSRATRRQAKSWLLWIRNRLKVNTIR